MLFMVVEHFQNGDAVPVYRRFREQGRLAPTGLNYVSSWVTPESHVLLPDHGVSGPGVTRPVVGSVGGSGGFRGRSGHHVARGGSLGRAPVVTDFAAAMGAGLGVVARLDAPPSLEPISVNRSKAATRP